MFLIGVVVVILASATFALVQFLSKPLIAWKPDR